MTSTAARRLAWTLCGASLLLGLAAVVFLIVSWNTPLPEGSAFGFRGFAILFAVVFSILGALLAARVPANPIGWMFLLMGLMSGVQELGQQYATYALLERDGALPFGELFAWLNAWVWVPIIGTGSTMLFLLFPDGRLPSRAWRPVAVVGVVGIAAASVGFALYPGETEGFPGVRDPFGLGASKGAVEALTYGGLIALMLSVVASVVALLRRFRRSIGDERQQIKVVVFAASFVGFALVATVITNSIPGFVAANPALVGALDNVLILSFLALPVAAAIAVLRYGLYEIDVVINRTVVYGLLAAFITGVYIAIVVGVGALVGRRGGLVLPGVAAAAVALAFQPARQRARHLANRLVYGKRATPYEVLSDFSDRLGEAYAFEDVLPRMADLVREGTGSVSATVWVRVGGEMRPAATSPARAGVDPARVAVDDDALPELPGERALAVRHRGDLLGALTVSKSRGDPITPAEEKLLSDLAAQAGLVLRNVRLTEELKANLEELRASRQRIVAAQDEERRRIERNIHDGAQQQLVAMRVRLRLAQTLAAKDPAKAERMLEQLQGEMADALENLRDLARGIYPPLLADAGLAAAVESQARKSPVPVAVEADGIGRYGRDVEAAVYFCVLEAVQNASKYAGEAHVRVRLFQRNGELAFAVEDDGPGFDVATTPRGSGLQNMADRIEALGGTLEIRSAPEQGTVVAGRVPAEGIAT